MTDLAIHSVKFAQPVGCKCGKPLSRADVDAFDDKIQIVCSACHSSLLEIKVDIPEESAPWD